MLLYRLSTILNSDKIYVVDKGVISEGRHDDLLTISDLYKTFMKNRLEKYNVVFIWILINFIFLIYNYNNL